MHQFFSGTFFNFEAVRILGTCRYGGCEVAEFLDAIGKVKQGNAESWNQAWAEQARLAEELAVEALSQGQISAARSAFFRAANYTRASGYMYHGEAAGQSDRRTITSLHRARDLFRKAVNLLEGPVYTLDIPYGKSGVTLPAYLYLPPARCRLPDGKTPLIVNPVGADSIQEEIYFMHPAAGPKLGYAVLTFEGPGQGLTLHEHNIPFRQDWEAVNSLVLDYVLAWISQHASHDENLGSIDASRIGITGASLGGYFALRAAADSRFAACAAIDPLYDLFDFATKHVSPAFIKAWEHGWVSDGMVDALMGLGMAVGFQTRWEIATARRFLGVATPAQCLKAMRLFTLREDHPDGQGNGSYLKRVKCPVLVTGAAESLYLDVTDHTAAVFEALGGEKELWVGTSPGAGGLQAKMGAIGLANQRVFAFFDRQLGVVRETPGFQSSNN
ncbi:uncharacterized protein PpBr36_10633 [Pyricularia pennisetigena]|uniref:uncharacterized protein n=1 Tax=Pyricularia pennisetigena TaxID=1578925 RepID=UPI001150CEE4|nr:uncharacterized protein PpBr36_10633 [Pyricularia pennisetigena]TLS21199.1 hypothetical protein PpBr36_10633 [Pyricularia pennisetigena]